MPERTTGQQFNFTLFSERRSNICFKKQKATSHVQVETKAKSQLQVETQSQIAFASGNRRPNHIRKWN